MRVIAALMGALAIIFGSFALASAPAHAAQVQPDASNIAITDANGEPITTVANNTPYKITFDFELANANPGDTFVVAVPEGFVVDNVPEVALDEIAVARRTSDTTVTVTFTDAVASLENLRGGFTYTFRYAATPEEGEIPDCELTIGNTSVYLPELKYGPGPEPMPLIINKWSGFSTDTVNARGPG